MPESAALSRSSNLFGLPVHTVEALHGVFSGESGVRQVILYGSRAKGNHRPGSDIDLVLDAPDLPFARFLQLEQAVDDLLLPYEVDLALLSQIESPALLEHIARVGQVFWSAH